MDTPHSPTPTDAAPTPPAKPTLSPVAEALAKHAAMRPKKSPPKTLPKLARLPKVNPNRKNRRKIPKAPDAQPE